MSDDFSDLKEPDVIRLARINPNFFIAFVLGITQGDVHIQMQDHLSKHDDCYTEAHRGIGKTTQLEAGRCTWEIGHNTDIRIKVIQQTDTEATKTTALMRHIIESDRYQQVFPHVKPDREQWGKQEFSVKGSTHKRDATVNASGVFGRAGGRADILIGDDLCDLRNSILQPALREQVKEAWTNNWLPMRDFSQGRPPRTWKQGTPYHVSDITADFRTRHRKDGTFLSLPVVNYRSPWGEVFTDDILRGIREDQGPIAYARAYELTPVSNEILVFRPEWLEDAYFESIPSGKMECVAAFDLAFTEKRQKDNPDWSVAIVAYRDQRNHIWVDSMVRERMTFPEFKDKAIRHCARREVKRSITENNGPLAGIQQQLNREAPFPVRGIERVKDKISRAVEKQAFFESGRFHIRANRDEQGVLRPVPELQPLYDELVAFPAADHDDCVDAAVDLAELALTSPMIGETVDLEPVRNPHRNSLSRLYG